MCGKGKKILQKEEVRRQVSMNKSRSNNGRNEIPKQPSSDRLVNAKMLRKGRRWLFVESDQEDEGK